MTALPHLLQRVRLVAQRLQRIWRMHCLHTRITQMDLLLARPDLTAGADLPTQALWAAQRAALRCELAALERAR